MSASPPATVAIAAAAALAAAAATYLYVRRASREQQRRAQKTTGICENGVLDLIGDTPLVKLNSLSRATGRTILAKCEYSNPGGSTKDRACLRIVSEAMKAGALKRGQTIYEGTVGSTGISLAFVSRALGVHTHICMPDDQAKEKAALLRAYGATVEQVRPLSIVDPSQYVNLAQRRAADDANGYFADQFENLANARAHYETTGREIWQQTGGNIDGFVCGAGTGGTLAGISTYLKEQNDALTVCLVDPPGSGLMNKVKQGVMYAETEAEGRRKRHQVDTVTEGVGINRMTRNFAAAQVDDAVRASDAESIYMSRYLMRHEALFVGSSSALCCVGAVKLARKLPPGSVIVTILCDHGARHMTKFWNQEYLRAESGVEIDESLLEDPMQLNFIADDDE